jgi:toxin ParE1/3/4
MKFHLAQAAIEDLESIDDYTVRTWDADQADRYLAMIWASFERIAENPCRWRLRPELHPECRICLTGRHAILFRLRDDRVEIARILHDAMDLPRHAEGLFEGA